MLTRIVEGRQAGRPLALLLVAFLGLVCVWLLIRIAATLLGADSGSSASAIVAPAAGLTAPPAESLARWHIFGSGMAAVDTRQQAATAPDTDQDLKLVGLFADEDPGTGVAFIADAAGVQAAYRVGAALPGGSRLQGVFADRVLLDRNGRQENLRIEIEPGAAGMSGGTVPVAPMGTAIPASVAPIVPSIPGAANVDWAEVQKRTGMDPAELAQQVRVLPVIENGSVVGMRISGGTAAPMIAKLGLRPDDIVTAVNGVSVRDVSRAQDIMASVRDARSVSVTVRRDGNEQTLNVDLK